MGMAEDAFTGLWPEKEIRHDFSIKYSAKFKGYNANVKLYGKKVVFNLSRNWKPISKDIKMGLLQELMGRLFRDKKTTPNIDLYHIFLKKVHIAVPKTKKDAMLGESFSRVNREFFSGMMEMPNLEWNSSATKLGSYDYGSDTITISRMLEDDQEIMDYVMYHEMLHKKHKFSSKKGRLYHHTREFKSSERAFPNSAEIEIRMKYLRPKQKKKFSIFRFF